MTRSKKLVLVGISSALLLIIFGILYWRSLPVTPRQASIYPVYGCNGLQVMDVVFIHGVDGDYESTWEAPGAEGTSWLHWLGEVKPGIAIWSADYPVATTKLSGKTMELIDRGRNLVARLINKKFAEHPNRPLVFVCHSFGGLVAKQLLRAASESNNPEWQIIAGRAKGVVFIATPHQGSDFASFFRHIASRITTVTERELQADNALLLDLNRWYRDHSPDMGIKTLCFAEGHKIAGEFVVPPGTADANIKDSEIERIDANHINICKLISKDQQVFESTVGFIEKVMRRQPPLVYPDPTAATSDCETIPSAEEAATEPKYIAADVVLYYENKTADNVELVLFDWGRHYKGQGIAAWTHFTTKQSAEESHYEDFEVDRKGWFSIYVINPDGSFSGCLATTNLFSTAEPRILIKRLGNKYAVEIQ